MGSKNVRLQMGMSTIKLLTEEMCTNMMIKSGRDDKSRLTSYDVKRPSTQSKSSEKIQLPNISDVDKHFVEILLEDKKVESFNSKVLGRITDIGGHPQLLELLPRFISGISLGIVVIDLSQGLNNHPISYFYAKDGKSVGKGIRSNLTNEQIVRMFLQIIVSQSTEQRNSKVMIVGTHRDVEYKCWESRRKKEQRLKDIITSFGLLKKIKIVL